MRLLDFRPDSLPDLKRLYASGFRPDAIVCGNDETAVRLMETLLAMDKRIPQDVAVVGFDDIDLAASFRVPLTTVRQPVRLIAKTVLRTLLARSECAYRVAQGLRTASTERMRISRRTWARHSIDGASLHTTRGLRRTSA